MELPQAIPVILEPPKMQKFSELYNGEMQLLYSYLFALDPNSPYVATRLYYLEYYYNLQPGELFRLYDQLMTLNLTT